MNIRSQCVCAPIVRLQQVNVTILYIYIEKYHVEEMHICARVHAVHQLYTIEILFQ